MTLTQPQNVSDAGPVNAELLRDIFARCSPPTASGCWEFQGSRSAAGYGMVRRAGATWYTHRLVAEAVLGYTPEQALHSCDNPPCCNPAHLRDGTHAHNMADKVSRARCNPVRGSRHKHAKLTEANVRAIRGDNRPNPVVAEQYGVNPATIGLIKRRVTWRHVL